MEGKRTCLPAKGRHNQCQTTSAESQQEIHLVQDFQVKQQLFKKTKATGTDTDDTMLKSVICSGIYDGLKHKVDQESMGGYLRSRLLWIEEQNTGFPSREGEK